MGTLLGERFLILDRIGHGASGTIYRGEHVTLRRKVAIKVLHQELSRDDLAIERFRREATTVSEIDNEHIVEIHDFGRTPDGRQYLAMELLDGETLQDVLKRERRMSVEAAVDILVQLGEALMEAHAMGYVHRDLRPRNIYIVSRRGRQNFVKLLDFGLAKLVETDGNPETTSLGMTFGDPKYMSPEQARGEPVDRRADIYSLGCIAYEMLTGQAPFTGGKVFDILTKHVDSVPRELRAQRSDIPPWLDVAIMRMLSKRPGDRFVTVYNMIGVLEQGGETEAGGEKTAAAQQPGKTAESKDEPAKTPRVVAKPPAEAESSAESGDKEEKGIPQSTMLGHAVARTVAPAGAGKDDESAKPQEVAPSPSGKQRAVVAEDSNTGISTAWFADGDDALDELDDRHKERLQEARASISPSDTSLIIDGDRYEDPHRRRMAKIAGIVLGGFAVVVIVALAWPSSGDDSHEKAPGDKPAAALVNEPNPAANPESAPVETPEETPGEAGAVASAEPAAEAALAAVTPESAKPPDEPAAEQAPDPAPESVVRKPRPAARVERKPSRRRKPKASTRPPAEREPPPTRKSSKVDELQDPFADPKPSPKPKKSDSDKSEASKQAEFFAKLGKQALRKGDIGSAASNFKKALDLNPRNADAAIGQGEIAMRSGSYNAAISHLKKAARLRSKSSYVHTLLGEAYLFSGRKRQAVASFKKALKLSPKSKRAQAGLDEATGRTL